MGIYDSKLWLSDLDEVLQTLPEIGELAGKNVLVTGASGLICSALVDVLVRWNRTHEDKISILAAGRNGDAIAKRFVPYSREGWFHFMPYDAAAPGKIVMDCPCDYMVHGASNASPGKILAEPVETMLDNVLGMKRLLDCAKEQGTRRVLFVSSSEVYGQKEHDRPCKNDEYGWIDILNPRSSYSIGKCAAETMCAAYHAEFGVESVIVRPGHVYGPTSSESDTRVSSAWAYAAARGEDLVMKSDGSQIRSYCYCLDCASAMLKVMLKGENVHAYNISNPDSIVDIRGMAEILAKTAGVELKMELPTEAEKKGFNPMSNSSLDSSDLLALGWKGLFDAERGFAHTVAILKEILAL